MGIVVTNYKEQIHRIHIIVFTLLMFGATLKAQLQKILSFHCMTWSADI